MNIQKTRCPECDHRLKIKPQAHEGYRVRCNSCDTILEVVSTNPLELDVAMTARPKYSHRETFDEDVRRSPRKGGRTRRY